ncbi:hypothetical protein P4S64_10475 [Vibrio sp. M60_M31a]
MAVCGRSGRAALSGVSVAEVNNTLITAANAKTLGGHIADGRELNPLPIEVQLRREDRDDLNRLEQLYVRGRPGIAKVEMGGAVVDAPQPVVQLSEIGQFVKRPADKPIFHKNLNPVVYVYAEVVGRVPGEIIADVIADQDTDHASDAHVNWQDRTYLNNGAGVAWSVQRTLMSYGVVKVNGRLRWMYFATLALLMVQRYWAYSWLC